MPPRVLIWLAAFALLPSVLAAQEAEDAQSGVYTTHKSLPWSAAKPLPSPHLLRLDEEKPHAPKPEGGKPSWLSKVPFGKPSSDVSQPLPKGPQMMQSVPVQGVDTIEVTEPAAPSTAPLEADPASEDPETPTEETAPIFSAGNVLKPNAITFRALNKVTGRSELIEAPPGETVRFGKLDITAITCQMSDPNSQRDHAGYFEMSEHVPAQTQVKPLFRGWMYATSPSITSLEHPIYDVTMVECVTDATTHAAAKKDTASKKAEPVEEATDTSILD